MKDFVIITDSCSDLDRNYIEQNNIPYAMLTCRIGNVEYNDDFGGSLPYKKFYDLMRGGEVPKTSQPNTNDFYEIFKKQAEKNLDILYIGVSSGLSGTIGPAHIAENMIQDEFEGVEIYIFDSLTASLGQGAMVMKALELKSKGASMMEIVDYLETNVQRLNTYMIVNDLNHLKRGGRINSAAVLIGTVLKINPLLSINHEGKVLPMGNMKGRKKAISKLADLIAERIEEPEGQTVCISHGDCYEEALELKNLILEKINPKDIYMNFIGPVVGTYGGPGAMAIFFMGKERQHHIIG